MKKIAILLFCLFVPSAVFGVDVLMTCGASKGHSYYFNDGWTEDSISTGQTALIIENDELDVLFFTDIQGAKSYRQQGVAVIPLSVDEDLVRIAVLHDTFASIYNFLPKQKKLIWVLNATNQAQSPLAKAGMYVSECE